MTGDVIWIHVCVDGVMTVWVTSGMRLGMWLCRCSGVTVGVPIWGCYRDIAVGVAPMCSWCMSVGVGRTMDVYMVMYVAQG